jgi:hypothetical protein
LFNKIVSKVLPIIDNKITGIVFLFFIFKRNGKEEIFQENREREYFKKINRNISRKIKK